ncbi:hypothetical protein [Acaryochloris sp. IP29b_bin.148]|uniref:hypothetical protein n=1 Tax=Acaryochloris sp. IP29b_bin.148 TaxID=2969218 RepID=UPI002624EE60|nr:hypothetical protein [Acaryochloris sp. IP29b_bin.148]
MDLSSGELRLSEPRCVIAQRLADECQVTLSSGYLREMLAKSGAIHQVDLEMLRWAATSGRIDLYFLDEADFCLWMSAEYSYFFRR